MSTEDPRWLGQDVRAWRESIRNGFTRAHLFHALDRAGVFEALARAGAEGRSCASLAEELGLDERLLRGVLDYSALADTVLEKAEGRYRLGPTSGWLFESCQRQAQVTYLDGYRVLLEQLVPLLRGEVRFGRELARGEAKSLVPTRAHPNLAAELRALGARSFAELRCARGEALVLHLREAPEVTAVGVEPDAAELSRAREAVEAAGFSDRGRWVQASPLQALFAPELAGVDALNADGLLGELLEQGGEEAVLELLAAARRAHPGRALLVWELRAKSDEELSAMAVSERIRFQWYQHLQHPLAWERTPRPRPCWQTLFARAGVTVEDVREQYLDLFYVDRFLVRL